ncbi:uncharacterized protein LOC126990934 [Eriocheir sinensis]|uniref:uncharacterized protein LOC126990934 n=1 Tax=Eriocheir sinensis TaxID=95602 RepID=UPI0021C6C798|nr:uncharacterized protein LOC126990934 [Eriocheir sinensis]
MKMWVACCQHVIWETHSGDSERLKAQCRGVAVPSEWILSGQAVHPRPHPKNVRYLEEYKLKERCADGTIVAVPCSLPDNTNTNTTAGKKKKKKCVVCVSGWEGRQRFVTPGGNTHWPSDGGVSEGSSTKRRGVVCVSGWEGRPHITTPGGNTHWPSDGGVSEGSRTKRRRGVVCVSQAGEEEEGSSLEKQEEALNGLTNGGSGSNTDVIKYRKQTRRRGKKLKGGDEVAVP